MYDRLFKEPLSSEVIRLNEMHLHQDVSVHATGTSVHVFGGLSKTHDGAANIDQEGHHHEQHDGETPTDVNKENRAGGGEEALNNRSSSSDDDYTGDKVEDVVHDEIEDNTRPPWNEGVDTSISPEKMYL